ncbi:DUF362 domain-containing protein [Desulfoscipio geothermicus]|uniref:Uncharacterized conserved protein, DUF362 family n=1 Tax=Desulfoscipio geothermicus DSM 3669 TaxID=1121426 RepID=A0A1I6CQE1_9FIRM|nr:DUF362 domain-containing protein [Desulfoscipio geothermicus]SFQ95385.1 Uncharacterized conserved protein, DUF362 family [Desulfoscipio geothermicus DSM 3669]
MEKNRVAVVRYTPGKKAVEKAISLCEGIKDLKPYHKVMIKPNVVLGGKVYKNLLKGVVTNTVILEELILFLKDFGCTDICIGEGSVLLPDLGVDTATAFNYSGITELAKRYEVKLMDFYQYPFESVTFEGKKVDISLPVLESDYIINVPVLKTHNQTKVSLSIKNLKGVLSFKSKKSFHDLNLERYIALLGSYIQPQLNIVDGIYTVNNGPVSSDWQQVGIVLAGNDPLSVDVVGATILGFAPHDVGHLREYADITGGSLDIDNLDIKGEPLESIHLETRWDEPWPEQILKLHGIQGVSIPAPGQSLCSSCGFGIAMALHMFFREVPGQKFDKVEIRMSRDVKVSPGSKNVFLLGKCAINANKHIINAVKIKGCPPSINDCYNSFKEHMVIAT